MAIRRLFLIGLIPIVLVGCQALSVEEEPEEYVYVMTASEVCSYVEKNLTADHLPYELGTYLSRNSRFQLTFDATRAEKSTNRQTS